MAWPLDGGTIDTTMQGSTLVTADDHAQRHRELGSFVNAAGSKLGLSSGTPALNQILVGNGAGSAIWNGTWNQANLGSPTITNGTINNATFGTPLVTGGTINNTLFGTIVQGGDALGDIYYRGSNGTLTRLGTVSPGKVLSLSSGTIPSWQAASTMYQINPSDGSTTSSSFGTVSGGIGTVAITYGSANVYVDAHANMFNSAAGGICYLEVTYNNGSDIVIGQQGYVIGNTDSISNKAGGGTVLGIGTYVIAAQIKTSASGTARFFQMGLTILSLPA